MKTINTATELEHSVPVSDLQRHDLASFRAYPLKRIFDITVALCMMPVILPVIGIFALLIRRDGGPAFYGQQRVGLNGENFTFWKLRSMVIDADRQLELHLAESPEAKAEWERHQKLKKDPRITSVGRIIRKTSLDELPQIFNVLLGDMSFVGPRPFMPSQKAMYDTIGNSHYYYKLRPGITGLWQISARHDSSFISRVRYDALYARKLSLWTDFGVMLRTVKVVLKGSGV